MSLDHEWREKLQPLVERDHFIREALVSRGVLSDAYHPEMEKVHLENAQKLKKIIFKKGFPVLSNAGTEGVRLAWLIIQHAISDPDFMRDGLVEMRMAAAQDDFPKDLLAYTEDRVAFFEGRPQIFGTNLDWIDSELKPTPIADMGSVNLRRESMGLAPLDLDGVYVGDARPPKDPLKKSQEFEAWLKRVGWR
jgi:hypothetical protein